MLRTSHFAHRSEIIQNHPILLIPFLFSFFFIDKTVFFFSFIWFKKKDLYESLNSLTIIARHDSFAAQIIFCSRIHVNLIIHFVCQENNWSAPKIEDRLTHPK